MVHDLSEQGVNRLAITVGESARGAALTRVLALKGSPGWLVSADEVRQWRFEGITEQGGTVSLYGPHVAGTPLESVWEKPLASALPFLFRLVRALVLLSKNAVPRFALQADAVLFTDSGSVLFLPPEVIREIRGGSPFAVIRDTFESLNHPDLEGDARASFTIAVLLYRIITGRFPFSGVDAEELHEQTRKLDVVPPDRVVADLSPEISRAVMEGLGRSRQGGLSLEEWGRRLSAWQSSELFSSLGSAERAKTHRDAGMLAQGSEKSFHRRMFWEKNWKTAAVIAAVIIVLGAGAASIVRNATKPRLTRGFSPAMVVEAFYTSMNSLDHMMMEACVTGKAGQTEISQTTTLYVMSRVTQAYEGKSGVISAANWAKDGRPKLVSPASLYGVTDLTLVQEREAPVPVFHVTYDKWTPGAGDSTPAAEAPKSEGRRIVDRVRLRADRDGWVIDKIERLRQDPLPPP
jgi:hypothetical protein